MSTVGPLAYSTELSAFYETAKKQLVLTALVPVIRSMPPDIHFHREPWPGGLRFALEGDLQKTDQSDIKTGENNIGTDTVRDSFDIDLPNRAYPSGYVIIVTLNYPNGIAIPIHFDGLLPPIKDFESKDQPPAQQQVSGGEDIYVLPNHPFKIKQAIGELKVGHTITESHDASILKLVSSSVMGTDIVWEFVSDKDGDTEVVVGVAQTNPSYMYIVPWKIHIRPFKA